MMPMQRLVGLESEIAGIGDLDREQLAARWKAIFGCRPPTGVRRELLSFAVAWDLQTKRMGGLPAEPKKALKLAMATVVKRMARRIQTEDGTMDRAGQECAESGPAVRRQKLARSSPQRGARLIREWNGKANVVDVVQGGYLFEGQTYRSLSAIARKITNAHWSGPRFFGL
jgi:hypothetical protein